jgi:hypothetical protein
MAAGGREGDHILLEKRLVQMAKVLENPGVNPVKQAARRYNSISQVSPTSACPKPW